MALPDPAGEFGPRQPPRSVAGFGAAYLFSAMSYYDVLGIPIDADEEAIRSAFRGLARRYHPDAGEGSSAERFRQVAEAYATLSDPAHRRVYDLSLRRVRPRVVPVEPLSTNIFFHHTRPPDWDNLFDEILHSIDEFFGPPFFRW